VKFSTPILYAFYGESRENSLAISIGRSRERDLDAKSRAFIAWRKSLSGVKSNKMSKHNMFLAMVLTNAKREEASGVVLTVEGTQSRIDMLLHDGSSTPLTAPPPEILLKMIESLEQGETEFRSAVYEVTIEQVVVQRGADSMRAHVSVWNIGHC
jgi:hypothetical protein